MCVVADEAREEQVMTAALLALALLPGADARPPTAGLILPKGFEASVFADSQQANDIHCMTIDSSGRIVVAGRGYLRIFVSGKDGKIEKTLSFTHPIKDGANGLFWEKGDLWCVGDGGLRIYRNVDSGGLTKPSELVLKLRTGSEHMAHAVGRGPDGWLYLLVGDATRIDHTFPNSKTTPVRDPIGGCVLRLSPDLKTREIVADGFRNAYAMDWNLDGELFTYDSDNERCVSLPWYEHTRLYHVQSGGHHGWLGPMRAATWRRPAYFLDTVAPVATLGRGSPTGVVCYRHTQFPKRYQGGIFALDWTFGVIHFVALEKSGASYVGKPVVFARSKGDDGFAPTACAVHPKTGDLFVSIGGRGTRGAVYRIRYTEGQATGPLKITPPAIDNGATEKRILSGADRSDSAARREAARLLLSLDEKEQKRIAKLLTTPLQRTTLRLTTPDWDIADLLKDVKQPARVRLDAVRLLQRRLGDLGSPSAKGTVWEGYSRYRADPKMPDAVKAIVRGAFPSGNDTLDYELSRLLAMIEDDDETVLKKMADKLTERSHPTDDVHYLIVLARLKGKRTPSITKGTADALIRLDDKIVARKMNRDNNWPSRLAEMHAGLAANDGALNQAILAHREFGRPDHVLWTREKGMDREKSARIFLARSKKDESFAWNASLVSLIGKLPADESLPVLRGLWGESGLDDEILGVLAKFAREEDHEKFLRGLTSPRLPLVATSLDALENQSTKADRREKEGLALLKGIRQLPSGKEEDALRKRFLKRLAKLADSELANLESAMMWYRKLYPEQSKQLASADGVDVETWNKRLAKIDWDKGDARRGQFIYTKASCASCHSGAAALGPDLAGVTGRFSRTDLFTAILQPSKDVSGRYRTTQLTTEKGKVYSGIIIYDAVDSVILQTGPAETVRLAHTQISSRRLTALSLMPAGLLDRLSDSEIADLYGYLKTLGRKSGQ